MKILFLDDDELRHTYAAQALIGHDVHHVRTVPEALASLAEHEFDVAMLDHDLGGTQYAPSDEESGYQVAVAIAERVTPAPRRVVVHSYNQPGAARMVTALRGGGVQSAWFPFGPTSFAAALGWAA